MFSGFSGKILGSHFTPKSFGMSVAGMPGWLQTGEILNQFTPNKGGDSFGRGVQNWVNYIGGGDKGDGYMGGFQDGGNEMNLGGFINPATYLDGGDGNWGR